MSFLLDSDICSAYMKGHPAVVNRFFQYGGRLHISVVSAAELFAGALRSRASPSLLPSLFGMLNDLITLDVTMDVAGTFGTIRAELMDRGLQAPSMDLLIASTALVHGLTVVTHNTKHFSQVPGLHLADWLAP